MPKTNSRISKIKVGIAGLGRSGWGIHCRLLDRVPDRYEVAAAFDNDPKRLDEMKARYPGCRTYTRYASLLADKEIDLAIVALPSQLHAKCTIQALNAGKHVICEKPMTTNLRDSNRMIAAARKTGKILTIFQNRRYNKDFLAVKKIIDSGVLGRIVQISMCIHGFGRRWDWQTLKRYGGGLLNNYGAHLVDQALVLFGSTRPRVFCVRDRALTLGDADDHFKLILHGRNAPVIEIESTAAAAYPRDLWLVMGTRGGLRGNEKELRWKYVDPKKMPERKLDTKPTPDRTYQRDNPEFIEKTWLSSEDPGKGELGFYLDLHRTLRLGKPLAITPESVRRQIRVLDQCRKMAPV